ncbi:MAG: GntR family transcriptional regulator [Devosia sp.]|nr:GntR family transcriptional regulator [Devosia sp.]
MAQRNTGYERFRAALLDGRVRLGATLTQSDLCVILDMSLSPMRETMTLLQEEGLITVRKRAGVQVFHPDIDFFRANFQMRMLLEKEAVRRFARNASFEQLDELTQIHEACVADLRQAHPRSRSISRYCGVPVNAMPSAHTMPSTFTSAP